MFRLGGFGGRGLCAWAAEGVAESVGVCRCGCQAGVGWGRDGNWGWALPPWTADTGQYTTIQNFAFVLCDIGTVAFFCVASVESIDILSSSVERRGEFLSPYSVFTIFRIRCVSRFGFRSGHLRFAIWAAFGTMHKGERSRGQLYVKSIAPQYFLL